MLEKHKNTIMWVGIIGGIFALGTATLGIVAGKSPKAAAFLTKIKGGS